MNDMIDVIDKICFYRWNYS